MFGGISMKGRVVFSPAGKKALIVGAANAESINAGSIAFGRARAFCAPGAEIALTSRNEKAEALFRPIAEKLETNIFIFLPLAITSWAENHDQHRRVFAKPAALPADAQPGLGPCE
jgi:enoyl-[acyl-carrier-protein] reductase (NADH)